MHEKDVKFDREVGKSREAVKRYSREQMGQMIDRLKAKARERDEAATYAVLDELKRRLCGGSGGLFT